MHTKILSGSSQPSPTYKSNQASLDVSSAHLCSCLSTPCDTQSYFVQNLKTISAPGPQWSLALGGKSKCFTHQLHVVYAAAAKAKTATTKCELTMATTTPLIITPRRFPCTFQLAKVMRNTVAKFYTNQSQEPQCSLHTFPTKASTTMLSASLPSCCLSHQKEPYASSTCVQQFHQWHFATSRANHTKHHHMTNAYNTGTKNQTRGVPPAGITRQANPVFCIPTAQSHHQTSSIAYNTVRAEAKLAMNEATPASSPAPCAHQASTTAALTCNTSPFHQLLQTKSQSCISKGHPGPKSQHMAKSSQ